MRLALRHADADWTAVLSRRDDFQASNLYGRRKAPGYGRASGRLPEGEYDAMLRMADYIIFSYATPIAWHSSRDGLWFVPDISYSMSTTRQQNKIRRAIRPLNEATVAGEEASCAT